MNIVLLARNTLYTQPGGDTVQVLKSAESLEKLGHHVDVIVAGDPLPQHGDVLHGFNLGRPADLLPYFKRFQGKKVLSSIFVDYSVADSSRHPFLFSLFGQHGMEWIKTIGRGLNGSDRFPGWSYVLRGQRSAMNELLNLSDHLITSSASELIRIQHWARLKGKSLRDKHAIIPLGILEDYLQPSKAKVERKGLLIVGRLETLKNQLQIMRWAEHSGWDLTVVGDANTNQPNYYRTCQKYCEEGQIRLLPYQDVASLIELMDTHQVLLIPSSFESYSLVGWEAAARGMVVLANNVADMTDTLSDVAHLVDFEDRNAATTLIEAALRGKVKKKSQVQFEDYTWNSIGQKIEQVYL